MWHNLRVMPDVPRSETCLCGTAHWHVMIDGTVWCRRCGCLRSRTERTWRVPFDRTGELSSAVVDADAEEAPTDPGTPEAKRV